MADATPRFSLPFILTAQAQKEITHNESLIALDVLSHALIEDRDLGVPPSAPLVGQTWLVAAAATGAWAGEEGRLASFDGVGWRFFTPVSGMVAWLRDEAHMLRHDGGQWLVGAPALFGGAFAAIGDPVDGGVVDAEARAVLALVLNLLRFHGFIAL